MIKLVSIIALFHYYCFQPSNAYKLNKFEIDWTSQAKTANLSLHERDVTVTNLYGKPRLLILRHQPILKEQSGAHILIYTWHKRDSIPQKTDILMTNLSGRFAINIVDDLIVVHHQTSKSSLIFDINLSQSEVYGGAKCHLPIVSKCVIKPYKINNLIDYELCECYDLFQQFFGLIHNPTFRLFQLGHLPAEHHHRRQVRLPVVPAGQSAVHL